MAHDSNNSELLKDPADSSCTPTWDSRSIENQRECLKLYKEILKRTNVCWQIKIQLKGPPVRNPAFHGEIWPHTMYPLEFTSEADAWDYLCLSPDPNLHPVLAKSWSVEAVRKARPTPLPEPKVRKKTDDQSHQALREVRQPRRRKRRQC